MAELLTKLKRISEKLLYTAVYGVDIYIYKDTQASFLPRIAPPSDLKGADPKFSRNSKYYVSHIP